MKKVIVAFVILFFAMAKTDAQINFILKGKASPAIGATRAVLSYNGDDIRDTVNVKGGLFEFKGTSARPGLVVVDLIAPRGKTSAGRAQPSAFFYLDSKSMTVEFDTKGTAKVAGGGKEQQIYTEYQHRKIDNKNFETSLKQGVANLVKQHPDSYVSLDNLDYLSVSMTPKYAQQLFKSLSQRMQNTKEGLRFKAQLKTAIRLDIGQAALQFTLNSPTGKAISLASYKGKYVLVDFWASWCGPCRATHPSLKKTYSNFKDKNFHILAVSLDTQKDLWLKAIKEDDLPWEQVSDLKGISSEVAKMYGITQIPQSLLIDPNGNIVGRNLKGQALDEKLAQLLK